MAAGQYYFNHFEPKNCCSRLLSLMLHVNLASQRPGTAGSKGSHKSSLTGNANCFAASDAIHHSFTNYAAAAEAAVVFTGKFECESWLGRF